jgi:hypothetical protein
MRILFLSFLVLIGCQEKSPPYSKSEPDLVEIDGYTSVRRSLDLLDVVFDASIKTYTDKLIFTSSTSVTDVGDHSSCEIRINEGDTFRHSFQGVDLKIIYPDGTKLVFQRISGSDGEIIGSWRNERRVGEQRIKTRLSILSDERLIMRTHCEA